MTAVGIDISRVATLSSLPQDQITTLLNKPTAELVRQFLTNISKKAKEFEESASSRLKLRVELDNANRSHEAKFKIVKSSLDKATEESAKLKEQLKTSEALRQSSTAELELFKSSSSSADSESNTLRSRIAALEGSQRDITALLEKKSAAYDELAGELSSKHQKSVELRKEISTLEQTLSAVNSKSSTWKIREQDLEQEVEALKSHNEWLDQELKTRNSEHSKFRKDKNARLAELQQQYEDATSSTESLQRTEQTLRTRLQEMTQKSEEYLQQTQSLRDELAQQTDSYRTEIDTANRLSELLQESLNSERERREELEAQLDDVRQDAADEIGKLETEINNEHDARLEAEQRNAELEVEIERLAADVEASKQQQILPGTPMSKLNGSHAGTPRQGSPMPGSRGGINYTQLVSDYHVVKSELDAEKRTTRKLNETIEEVMRDMALRQPEIDSLQADHVRLENDIVQLTTLLEAANGDRDIAVKDSKKLSREVNGLTKESDLLRQQLRDLSSQIKVLLMEMHASEQGMGDLSAEQRSALDALAHGDFDGEGAAPVSDTHRFISENLTTFSRIAELQENNARLLRLTRELGEQMEGQEAQQEKAEAAQNKEDLEDLRTRYETAKEEIKVLTTQSHSYIKERDMFRRMLSHRGKLPAGDHTLNFGESINGSVPPSTPARRDSIAGIGSPSSREMSDLTKVIKELQSQYDTYRNEAAQHQTILKQQSDSLAKQNNELRNEVSKRTNEATLTSDRFDMLSGNYNMLKSENQELQKRAQSLSDRTSKQEIRTQQLAEDLVEAKGIAESLRNETANLKAEKEFWKTVEKRLNDEIANLSTERDRLNGLNANLQSILNEKEHTDGESRRRMQNQVETMEVELQAARKKLNDEIDENKREAFRREYETQQSSTRIEELMTTLSTVREELVASQTTKDHLQSRVDELSIELRNTQETLEVYRPRPAVEEAQQNTTGITKEQELSLEVAELKKELDLTKKELNETKALIEQFKSISQHAEEELATMNDTYDQYRQETDSQLEERTSKITELEQTIESLRVEIREINGELLAATERGSEHSQQLESQKSTYESELSTLRDSIDRAQAAVQYHQEDLRKQAEIAQQAQQNYDNELLKHAEAAKALQTMRAEMSQIKLETVEYRIASEAAETKLQQSEESWKETKERYERELAEIRSRKDDVAAQNKLLHTQLESVNKNMGELRQKRSSDIGTANVSSSDAGSDTQNLNELVKYLQKEKTIVDTQYLRAQQESRRVQQQLDHTQTQLDEARLKLAQEQKTSQNSERQNLNHNKLMETLQELNVYRESNSTLRLEKTQVETSLRERTAAIDQLQSQILPLQSKIAELEEAKEMLETDVRLANEAKDRFEKRYLDILNRSNAVDPAEFESIKQKLTELEDERNDVVQVRDTLQAQVDAHPAKVQEELDQLKAANEERLEKFKAQAKERDRSKGATIKEKETALQSAIKEKEDLATQLQTVQTELEEAVKSRSQAESALAEQAAKAASAPEPPVADNNSDSNVSSAELESIKAELAEAKTNASNEAQRSSELVQQLNAAELRVSDLQTEVSNIQQSLANANTEITELKTKSQTSTTTNNETGSSDSEAVAALQQSLEAANSQITDLNAQIADLTSQLNAANNARESASAVVSDIGSDEAFSELQSRLRELESEAEKLRDQLQVFETAKTISEDGSISVADQIAPQIEEIRAELTRRHQERVDTEVATFKKRTDNMKNALNKRLADYKTQNAAMTTGPTQETLDNLVKAHADEMQSLNARHESELAELRKHAKPVETTSEKEPSAAFEPNEQQIKELLKNNVIARKLIQNSMDNRLKKLLAEAQVKTDAEVEKIRAEQQQRLENQLKDTETRITKAREDTQAMTEKKYNVKFNMAENRMAMAMAKVNYVEKAATETPNEPVSKVWEQAKTAKPASKSAVPAASTAPTANVASLTPANQPAPAKPVTPTAQSDAIPPASNATTASTGQATATAPAKPQPGLFSQAESGLQASTFGRPSGAPQSGIRKPSSGFGQPSGIVPPGVAALGLTAPATTGMGASQHARGGRGSSTGIPRGGGRGGSAIPRGGRGAASTGPAKNLETNNTNNVPANASSPDSPQTPMNPTAAQFIPGQKRALDGSETAAGDEKRTKTE